MTCKDLVTKLRNQMEIASFHGLDTLVEVLDEAADLLEKKTLEHDNRVTELLRVSEREVYRRRFGEHILRRIFKENPDWFGHMIGEAYASRRDIPIEACEALIWSVIPDRR